MIPMSFVSPGSLMFRGESIPDLRDSAGAAL